MSDIIKFLRHEDSDFKGRMLRELWEYQVDELESSHDIIQWLFPSDIPSKHHTDAPVLSDEQVNTMWRDPIIRESILLSSFVFAKFLSESKPEWLRPKNHNYLRITRILRCLWNMRMGDEFIRWRDFVSRLYNEYPTEIGEETFKFWMNAHSDELVKK